MDLLEAFSTVLEKNTSKKKLHLMMVGEGELKPKCQQYATNKKLPMTFSGFLNQTEIISAYVASDCLVLPSDYGETWGLVVNEAMACSIPAITSDRVGCHPDLIIPKRTGEVFPFGDIKSLSNLLLSYIKNPINLKIMGKEAHKHIKKFSYEEVVNGTLKALDFVCNK
jgi:glycosyltransferase involved in cell wall biosynthesis